MPRVNVVLYVSVVFVRIFGVFIPNVTNAFMLSRLKRLFAGGSEPTPTLGSKVANRFSKFGFKVE